MPVVYYLTHPQVAIDPAVPVPNWGLSAVGRSRAIAATKADWAAGIDRIISSTETKAIETAEIFAQIRGLTVESRPAMHENDRSATGFLEAPEFEVIADAFFAAPETSVRGWERAIDAQARIVAETEAVLGPPCASAAQDVLIVGHGAVGTLLMTHLLGVAISRSLDQPAGGGNVFAFDAATRIVRHRWQRLEEMG